MFKMFKFKVQAPNCQRSVPVDRVCGTVTRCQGTSSDNLTQQSSSFPNTMPVQYNRPSDNTSTSSEDSFETTINEPEPYALKSIQNELDAFEKRLLCGYSTLDTLPETELELPMLFIDNFSRIFRLWHENPVFKNSVASKPFYDIFSLMFRSLNDAETNDEQTENSQGLTGICDICDEEFEIIQNDAKKSYAEHEQNSETHIRVLHDFNKIGSVDNTKEDDFQPTEPIVTRTLSLLDSTKFTPKFKKVFMLNECFLKLQDGNPVDIECHLCDTFCEKQHELILHCNSKIHKKHMSYFFSRPRQSSFKKQVEFVDDLIFTKGNFFYCVLCHVFQPKENRNQHITEQGHKSWKQFAHRIFYLQQPYIHVINDESEMAFCELCCSKFPLDYGIVPHCQTKRHNLYKNFADEIRVICGNSLSMKNNWRRSF